MYLPRTLEGVFKKLSSQFPVAMVTGPRQVGKTTFLKHLSENGRTYVSLDSPHLEALAKSDPELFLSRHTPPVIIDEAQYAPELFRHIKMRVDEDRTPGQYWLTGPQQFHLMQGVSESLAGRVGIVNIQGLSHWEKCGLASFHTPFFPTPEIIRQRSENARALNLKEAYLNIWRGSFPAMLPKSADWSLFYSSYVQTYLERDIRHLAQVGNHLAFLRFLKATAARTGQLLNVADLAKDSDISQATAKNWLSILQTSGIIYLLQPYSNNITKRLIKTPKLYFLDTGLCCYLTEWSNPETLESGSMSGAILETFIVSETIKSFWHNGLEAPLYFYRDKDKREIDMILTQNNKLYPVEVKKSANPTLRAIQQFSALDQFQGRRAEGGLVCFLDTYLPLTSSDTTIPIGWI